MCRRRSDDNSSDRKILLGKRPTEVPSDETGVEFESLGGISRLAFQMSVAALPHPKLMRAIELLGTRVAPLVRQALASGATEPLLPKNSRRAA
jgi:hypothetical protein